MHEFAITYISVRIPNLPFERILISDLFPFPQYLSPGDRYHTALRNIINRYTCIPSKKRKKKAVNVEEEILELFGKRIICKKKKMSITFHL